MGRLCGEGSRSYLGRSRLVPERATVMNRSEKSAEAVVGNVSCRRAEREGQPRDVSLGVASHQKPGRPGRAGAGSGEAAAEAASDEATLARQAQTGWGADDLLGQALARERNRVAARESWGYRSWSTG
jgi:hypothetical protein